MQLDQPINLNEIPESENNFEPVPAGWYTIRVTDAALTPTKAGTGKYIKLRCDIMGPAHEGRVVFNNLNIQNPNPTAERIGREQLGALMRAAGLASVQDTDQLIGAVAQAKLSIRKSEEWGDSNEIKGFKSAEGTAPAAVAASAAASQAASKNNGGANKAPWQK